MYAEIIEITEKPNVPDGELGENVAGNSFSIENIDDLGGTSLRAILDIGLLDMQPQYLESDDATIQIIDASSDMLVVDITQSKTNYKVGNVISFNLQYMGALHLLNSNYIDKQVV
jgi:predicted amino acid racemase